MGVVCDEVVEITGPISEWQSSKIASRGFCADCGTSVWHKLKHTDKFTFGQGLFDEQSNWRMSREIFADNQPDHYAFAKNGQTAFTGLGTLWAVLFKRLPR